MRGHEVSLAVKLEGHSLQRCYLANHTNCWMLGNGEAKLKVNVFYEGP